MSLAGTTWILKEKLSLPPENMAIYNYDYSVGLFYSKENELRTCTELVISDEVSFDGTTVYSFSNNTYTLDDYRAITFIGEPTEYVPDETTFMTWLQANAVQDVTYLAESTDLTEVANAIREKTGETGAITFLSGFVSAINNIQVGVPADDFVTKTTKQLIGVSASVIPASICTGLSFLTKVSFPMATTIGIYAFTDCQSLEVIDFPEVSYIDASAFSGCFSLKTINVPKLSSVLGRVFFRCSALESVTLPLIQKIGTGMFESCVSLKIVDAPIATEIGLAAFMGCTSLITVNAPNVMTIRDQAFISCSMLQSLDFQFVTMISARAFMNCTSLSVVSLPNISSIYGSAFASCRNLMSVYLLSTKFCSISNTTFLSTPMTTSSFTGAFGSIYVPSSMLLSYKKRAGFTAYSAHLVGI